MMQNSFTRQIKSWSCHDLWIFEFQVSVQKMKLRVSPCDNPAMRLFHLNNKNNEGTLIDGVVFGGRVLI